MVSEEIAKFPQDFIKKIPLVIVCKYKSVLWLLGLENLVRVEWCEYEWSI